VIDCLQLLRNFGKFDSVVSGRHLPFALLTLIYAENGRGKTTLAALFRSLRSGAADLILDRHRLASANPPHIVASTTGGGAPCLFQNGAWSNTLPDIVVFDDLFVSENVCSGIEVEAGHRQNLHELILGAQGVALNAAVQAHVAAIEVHNRNLRPLANAIPAGARGPYDVDGYCALRPLPNIADLVVEAERNLAAAKEAEPIQRQQTFTSYELPAFDRPAIEALLQRDLPDLNAAAAAQVQAHIAKLGQNGERWVSDGMSRIAGASADKSEEVCPFCEQELDTSPIIAHYRAYFGEAYERLKIDIADTLEDVTAAHGGDVPAAFERAARVATQGQDFWRRFMEIPPLAIDTAQIARQWKAARDGVIEALGAKQAAPLEKRTLAGAVDQALEAYEDVRQEVHAMFDRLVAANPHIAVVKQQAAGANVGALTSDLAQLKAVLERFTAAVDAACQAYLAESTAKANTQAALTAARDALDQYRVNVFPAYEAAINVYLQRFGAGFRLGSVASVNNRGGSSVNYSVVINNTPVNLNAGAAGGPSFRNTLSAGDRNALALALFFVSLDRDPQLAQKIVVIDDPMTSLDDHRSLTTVQEIRRLAGRVRQVIVLSHSKPFLCSVWDGADRIARSAIKIIRDGDGSDLAAWDVRLDSITEHDKRHEKVAAYILTADATVEREVAAALRPILEAFIRVSYPAQFPPGTLLGPFIGLCTPRVNTPNEILNRQDLDELRDLLDYANTFHHDTNTAWETELINDQQLVQFCQRTLAFARRR
jgi:wobble nucleotide-excising tRNase